MSSIQTARAVITAALMVLVNRWRQGAEARSAQRARAVLTVALTLLVNRGWCQGAEALTKPTLKNGYSGDPTSWRANNATKLCVSSAVRLAAQKLGCIPDTAIERLARLIREDDLIPAAPRGGAEWADVDLVKQFNDHPSTSRNNALAIVARATSKNF